ncbi:serine hydrolase domain-containing protein [Pedobacter nanyangensis]|uniref:serine hydrolase domain-containing protein n=1 Tax=Pedobacter nanyangensis TaxID=1562389 RepID=UPI0013B476D0|nr:serine hydrolase domain-containing protein [Pedobacter nanyangensis]
MKSPSYKAVSGVIYIKGKAYYFNYGKLSNGQQPNNNTIYEIGSITKTYTGLLLSQAVHDRKIGLDDDVRKYLDGKYSNLTLDNGPITIRHLITHTSGLPLVMNCDEHTQNVKAQIDCFEKFRKEDFFKALKTVQPSDKSGENYHYSGVGTQLVGYILEQAYRMSHKELLQKYVFSRSTEKQTYLTLKQYENPNVSMGRNSEGKPVPLINGFYDYSGSMKASATSMLNYIKMYLESNNVVVKQTMSQLAGDMLHGRAYAWNTYAYNTPKKMLYHNGSSFGHSSWIALYPNQKVGIFIVTNVVTADSQQKLNEISNRIIDRLNIETD